MLQLHVWGHNGEVSVISPECRASAWLLSETDLPFEIVTSSNTNMSEIHRLPVLIDNDVKYQGFGEISEHLAASTSLNNLTDSEKLINKGLLNILGKFDIINQYNLYINPKNYEQYTRKQFQKYFPFPMMYNQPLKFYNSANEIVRTVGLNSAKGGLFSLGRGGEADQEKPAPQTEYVNDEQDQDEVPLSALHEKKLLAKSKEKEILKQSKNVVKCLQLLGEYLKFFEKDTQQDGRLLFSGLSSSEVLFYSYIYSLTFEALPDRFISRFLDLKKDSDFVKQKISTYNKNLRNDHFRQPVGSEVPSLYNEVRFQLGV